MAEIVTAVSAKELSDTIGETGLITALNTLFSGLLENNILGLAIVSADKDRRIGRQFDIIVKYEDAGAATLSDPFIFAAFTGKTAASVAQQAEDFIAAAGADFTDGPLVTYLNIISPGIDPYIAIVVSCADAANAPLNWKISFGGSAGTGGSPIGAAGGDLAGSYPNPTVVGIQGVSVPGAPSSSGQVATYDGTDIVWNAPQPTFASLAAAAAAQPQIVGSKIVIYPGSPTSEAGTYIVNSNTGVPGTDYTKQSDLTDTASEVSVADSAGIIGSSDVESALREIRGPTTNTITATGTTIAKSNLWNVVDLTVPGVSTTDLPAAPVNGEVHVFKDGKGDAASNIVTIDGNGNTIDGASTITIQDNFGAVALRWNGTEWNLTARYIPATFANNQYSGADTLDRHSFQYVGLLPTTAGAPFQLDLPSSPQERDEVEWKDEEGDAAANNITLDGNGNTIDGAASFVVNSNFQAGRLRFINGEWRLF